MRALDSIVNASRDENCHTKDNDDNNDVSQSKRFQIGLCVAISPLVEHEEKK